MERIAYNDLLKHWDDKKNQKRNKILVRDFVEKLKKDNIIIFKEMNQDESKMVWWIRKSDIGWMFVDYVCLGEIDYKKHFLYDSEYWQSNDDDYESKIFDGIYNKVNNDLHQLRWQKNLGETTSGIVFSNNYKFKNDVKIYSGYTDSIMMDVFKKSEEQIPNWIPYYNKIQIMKIEQTQKDFGCGLLMDLLKNNIDLNNKIIAKVLLEPISTKKYNKELNHTYDYYGYKMRYRIDDPKIIKYGIFDAYESGNGLRNDGGKEFINRILNYKNGKDKNVKLIDYGYNFEINELGYRYIDKRGIKAWDDFAKVFNNVLDIEKIKKEFANNSFENEKAKKKNKKVNEIERS